MVLMTTNNMSRQATEAIAGENQRNWKFGGRLPTWHADDQAGRRWGPAACHLY